MEITKYVLPVVVWGYVRDDSHRSSAKLGSSTYTPSPLITDLYDAESLAKAVKHMHVVTYILLLVNYSICSFLAGIIATLVAQRTSGRPAVVIG